MKTIHVITLALAVLPFVAACAATGGAGRAQRSDLTISIGQENVRVGQRTFSIGDAEAMRAGIAGACAHGCDSVEIQAIPMARYDAVLATYTAAVDNEAGAVLLRIAASPPVALSVGEAGSASSACAAEVVLRQRAIDVYINGELLDPDPACDEWGATICGSKAQDPMKREELAALGELVKKYTPRFAERTCVYFESEMPAMLVDHLMQTVRAEVGTEGTFALRRDRRKGRLSDDDVTEAIMAQSAALTACYDVELAESPRQMEAVVRLLIGPTGRVVRAGLRDKAMTTPRFDECLLAAVREFTFPKPEHGGTVEFTYPLRFSPR